MPTVPVYNQTGASAGAMELPPEVFGVRPKASVLHQVVTAHAANRRHPIAHTKHRGDVRGGGKKPWAQKHTGRARHGSIRSPIWVGGGITFGPRSDRNFAQGLNAKVRRLALRMALSDKVASKRLVVLDAFAPDAGKTKAAARVLATVRSLAATERRVPSVLIALPSDAREAARTIRNLSRVSGIAVDHLNAHDIIQHDILVTTRAGAARAGERFAPRARS